MSDPDYAYLAMRLLKTFFVPGLDSDYTGEHDGWTGYLARMKDFVTSVEEGEATTFRYAPEPGERDTERDPITDATLEEYLRHIDAPEP